MYRWLVVELLLLHQNVVRVRQSLIVDWIPSDSMICLEQRVLRCGSDGYRGNGLQREKLRAPLAHHPMQKKDRPSGDSSGLWPGTHRRRPIHEFKPEAAEAIGIPDTNQISLPGLESLKSSVSWVGV